VAGDATSGECVSLRFVLTDRLSFPWNVCSSRLRLWCYTAQQRLGLAPKALGLRIRGPLRLLHRLPQLLQGRQGVRMLADTMLGHRQERQDLRSAVGAILQRRLGFLVLAGPILGHAEGGLIPAVLRSPFESGARLAEGKVILDAIEVRLAEEGPAGLVIALRVGLLVITLDQIPGQQLGRGSDRQRSAQM